MMYRQKYQFRYLGCTWFCIINGWSCLWGEVAKFPLRINSQNWAWNPSIDSIGIEPFILKGICHMYRPEIQDRFFRLVDWISLRPPAECSELLWSNIFYIPLYIKTRYIMCSPNILSWRYISSLPKMAFEQLP